MSAWIASDKHIASVAYFVATGEEELQRVATLLKRENINSVNHRYSEKTRRTKCSIKNIEQLSVQDVYSLALSICYQSSEHPTWETTEAHNILSALIQRIELSGEKVKDGNSQIIGRWSI